MAHLSIERLRKSYGTTTVLEDIDLEIADREFACFLGPSGCGKSTLLRCIAGLESVQGGELRIDGRRINELPPAERDLAMVFQSYALYPHMTVRKNLAFGLSLRGAARAETEARIAEAARMLQLEALLERKPRQLSGGQRQRVAIGRAIVRQPRIFLFDEPLSNLDAALRENTRMELARLHERLQATMIYVTHDQVEAMTLASKVVVLNQGRIAQVGRPMELYHSPANLFVAGFIGSPRMNLLPVAALPALFSASAPAGAVTLGIRPEHLRLASPEQADVLKARISAIERLGAQTLVHLQADGGAALVAAVDGDQAVGRGDAVGLVLAPERMHGFCADGKALAREMA